MSSIRLVSWNVCDGFSRKFGYLERLRPDVAVVQEVRPGCLKYAAVADRAVWIGDPGQKGMAIIPYGGWRIETYQAPLEKSFLPVKATDGQRTVHLVAAWVDSTQRDLASPTLSALGQLASFMEAAPTIVAGDFNQTVTMDASKPIGRRFSDVLSRLESLKLRSAWHEFQSEAQGEESAPTLHWTWSEQRRFHIDFAFISDLVKPVRVELGGYEQYVAGRISDHVPLTIDFDLEPKS